MNSQERDQLVQFLSQLNEVKIPSKDVEAESLIREAVSRQPDAAYLLVQRTLLLEQALNNAKAQINDLQNQVQHSQAGSRGGFLNNDPWAQPIANGGQVPGAGNYQPPRYAQQPPQANAFGGASSFLGNVATTAAGVVAGSFLFQGIENLMGHHASPWGQHSSLNDPAADHTTINNYYGDSDASAPYHEAAYTDDSFDNSALDDESNSEWI